MEEGAQGNLVPGPDMTSRKMRVGLGVIKTGGAPFMMLPSPFVWK